MSPGGTIRRAAAGARRKAARSMGARGVGGTLLHAALWPARTAARVLSPARRARRRDERAFDRHHGVDTARDARSAWAAPADGSAGDDAVGYDPVPAGPLARALDSLPIEPGTAAFVDFGAGKGRALLLATHYPFARVLGVEHAPELHAIAAANLARYRPPDRIVADAEVVLGDARELPIPPEPAVFFFHDPFGPTVFSAVLDRIVRSLAERPRPAWIVYHDPRCGDLVERAGFRRAGPPDEGCAVYAPGGTILAQNARGGGRPRPHGGATRLMTPHEEGP